MAGEADHLFYLARVAQKIDRPDHTVQFLTQLIQHRPVLNFHERALLHTSYRDYVAPYRTAIQFFDSFIDGSVPDVNPDWIPRLSIARQRFAAQLEEACRNIIDILDNVLLVSATDNVARAFYQKMKGDYYRYLAGFSPPGGASEHAKSAELAYKTALALSKRELRNSDPLYLNIALTYSICEYELAGNHEKAIHFAEKTFQDAVKTLDGLNKSDYAESTSVMQLIRENISRWTVTNGL
jgi:14-3-3 protein epsilon